MPDTKSSPDDAEQPKSMEDADAANGEAPAGPTQEHVEHKTGDRQAQENQQDEPPA